MVDNSGGFERERGVLRIEDRKQRGEDRGEITERGRLKDEGSY